jgi:hypothetical protein
MNDTDYQRRSVTDLRTGHTTVVTVTVCFSTHSESTLYITERIVTEIAHLIRILGVGVKGPAADATDAPQPLGFLCNPMMKIISLFRFCL